MERRKNQAKLNAGRKHEYRGKKRTEEHTDASPALRRDHWLHVHRQRLLEVSHSHVHDEPHDHGLRHHGRHDGFGLGLVPGFDLGYRSSAVVVAAVAAGADSGLELGLDSAFAGAVVVVGALAVLAQRGLYTHPAHVQS